MPKIIIGNVDCESQCGDPSRRSGSERASSSRVALRMAWFLEPGDVLVTPYPLSAGMLAYIGRFKGFAPGEVGQVATVADGTDTLLITEELIATSDLVPRVRAVLRPGHSYGMISYFPDPGAGALAQRLELEVHGPDLEFLLAGRAAELSRKSLFRRLAEERHLPIPPGTVCHSSEALCLAIRTHLRETGSVIVKQDLAGGGEGNVALSLDLDRRLHPGACRTELIGDAGSLDLDSARLWSELACGRNTCLIVETFLLDAHPVYTEVDTRSPRVQVINLGSMRMDPTWVGFDYPIQGVSGPQKEELSMGSQSLGWACLESGYRGLLNCDAINTSRGLYFHEINVRYGGCSHLDLFCRQTLGEDYSLRHGIVTDNRVPFQGGFRELEQWLEAEGLAFDPRHRSGVVIMTEDLGRTGTFECMVVDGSHESALSMEDRLWARRMGLPPPRACATGTARPLKVDP